MAASGASFYAEVEADMTLKAGDAVDVHVDRATGRASIRRVRAADLNTRAVPLDWRTVEAEVDANAERKEAERRRGTGF